MHLRSPSFGPGATALLWGVGLGIYVWLFLWAVEVSLGTALLFGVICGTLIFFYVRVFGGFPLNRRGRG